MSTAFLRAMPEAPATTGPVVTPSATGKLTRSQAARLAALARWGKYKAKPKAPGAGRKPAKTPEEKEAARRQAAQDNRATVMAEFGSFGRETLPDLEAMAAGKEIDPKNADGMVMAGLAEKLSTGQIVLSAQGKKLYNSASRGDVGAAKEAIDRAEASAGERMAKEKTKAEKEKTKADAQAAAGEKKPAGGGGGGGGGAAKPDETEKAKAKAEQRAKTAQQTAESLGLDEGAPDELRQARDKGGVASPALQKLGLIDDAGDTTDQGRRALTALELGKPGDYRAAVADAQARLGREGAAAERQSAAERRKAEREADTAERRKEQEAAIRRDERRRVLRSLGETQKAMSDDAIKQTAQDRAMFANMGGGGGGGSGGGGGGGGKPSGGQGGLYAVNPETGKREPGQGLAKGAPPAPAGSARAEAAKPKEKPKAPDKATAQQTFREYQARRKEVSDLNMQATRAEAEAGLSSTSPARRKELADKAAAARAQARKLDTDPRNISNLTTIEAAGYRLAGQRGDRLVPARAESMAPKPRPLINSTATVTTPAAVPRPRKGETIYPKGRNEFASQVVRRAPGGYIVRPIGARPGSFADREMFVSDADASRSVTKGTDMDDPADLAFALDTLIDIAEALEPDAIKAGRRNSAADLALIDAILEAAEQVCELAMALGADGDEDEADDEEAAELSMDAATKAPFDERYAVKALGGDRIGGFAVLYGDETRPDLSAYRDYFTKATDYWLDAFGARPMLYHHAMEDETADDPVVGVWDTAKATDIGIWLEGELRKSHRYHAAIKEMIARGVLAQSSDSAPHLIRRERRPNGTHEVKRWPILCSSLTPTPAEFRMLPVGALKAAFDAAGLLPPAELIDDSLEAIDPDPIETADAVKMVTDDRARRLAMTLDLLALEIV